MTRNSLTYAIALGVLVVMVGCSKGQTKPQFGEAIDSNLPRVKLAELIAHPDQYEGKTVVVDGEYAGKCLGDDGDFYFKDQFDIIEADPPTPAVIAELEKGMAVRLYGVVKVRRRTAVPGEKPADPDVKIAAKGVQVL